MAGGLMFFPLSLSALLLELQLTTVQFSVGDGQQVSLKVQGVRVPSDSLVDFGDLLYRVNYEPDPSNNNTMLHDEALLCVTDLVECCESPQPRGDWFYPDGSVVEFDGNPDNKAFRANRGQNEFRNGRQFYGSVRLWRRFTPTERGRFRCEIPNAANPNISQTLYANILEFATHSDDDRVTISPSTGSTTTTAGERDYSLTCSATLFDPVPLPDNVPLPNFQWSFGDSTALPSGVTAMPTVMSSSNSTTETYSSTLQFSSPLSQSLHAGMYTCRLGAGRLVNNAMVSVNAPTISAVIITNLNTPLMVGQTVNTLTCDISGTDNLTPTTTYMWTRDGETVPDSNSRTLSLSPLQLSHAGNYSCHATISSPLLSNSISATSHNNPNITISIPEPQSFDLTSRGGTTVINGSDVTIDCTIEWAPTVIESELSLFTVDAQLFMIRNGVTRNLSLTSQAISGTTFTYTTVVNSFSLSDSGNYSCVASIRPSSIYLYGDLELSHKISITTGVYFSSRSSLVNANSNILITDIGEGDCGALRCYTDLSECCGDSDTPDRVGVLGQWIYPNGSVIGTRSDGQDFYVDRGPGVVRLSRRSNATATTGQFCCELPDATARNTRICLNVVAPESTQEAVCMSELGKGAAIGVGATIVIECLIGAPIVIATLLLCRNKSQKRTAKNIYEDNNLSEKEFQDGPKKGTYYNLSATAPALREYVYEDPNHDTTVAPTSTSRVDLQTSDTYEAMDINTTQESGGDNKLVYTYVAVPDSVTTSTTQCGSAFHGPTAEQGGFGGGGDDTYEVPDHEIVGTPPLLPPPPATGLAAPLGGGGGGGGGEGGSPYHGGVRESVYDEVDSPGVAAAIPPRSVNFQLTECMAYAETN